MKYHGNTNIQMYKINTIISDKHLLQIKNGKHVTYSVNIHQLHGNTQTLWSLFMSSTSG